MSKRKKAEATIINIIDKLVPGGENKQLYLDLFKSLNDRGFNSFMERLRDKKTTLSVIVPNDSKIKLDIKRSLKLGEELGVKFFQKLTFGDTQYLKEHTSTVEYLVMDLPFKRQSQTLAKGVAVAKDNKSINMLTGQVTGKSAASKLTLPEIQLLVSMGLNDSVEEIMKYRGGDVGGNAALNASLIKYGKADQETLKMFSTGVESTKTLKSFLNAMHLKSTL